VRLWIRTPRTLAYAQALGLIEGALLFGVIAIALTKAGLL
jgi:hypothetical protein